MLCTSALSLSRLLRLLWLRRALVPPLSAILHIVVVPPPLIVVVSPSPLVVVAAFNSFAPSPACLSGLPRVWHCASALSLLVALSLPLSLTTLSRTLSRCCAAAVAVDVAACVVAAVVCAAHWALFIQPTDTVCGHYFPKRSQPHNTHTRARTHARRRHHTHTVTYTHLRREQQQQQRRSSHRAHIHGVCAP